MALSFYQRTLLMSSVILGTGTAQAFSNERLTKILSGFGGKVSLSVRNEVGVELAQINGQTPRTPASIAKLFSTACALSNLEPTYSFKTLFGYTGQIQNEKLTGSLVFRGSGDPSFVIEDLREIVQKLRFLYRLKSLDGPLVFDASYFGVENLPISEGFEGDSGRAFTAPLTAMPFNQNAFSVWVASDTTGAAHVVAEAFPLNVLKLKILNQGKVGGPSDANFGLSLSYDPDSLVASVGGRIGAQAEPRAFYRSVTQPWNYLYLTFADLWRQSGGEWKNPSYKIEIKKQSFRNLYTHESRPLNRLLMDINKSSLNFSAELALLAAAAEKSGLPTDASKAKSLLKDCFKKFDVSETDVLMENASGLSRTSFMKASALTQFLQRFAKEPFAPEYLSSLSILGMDGTTRARLKNLRGQARLKTGTLSNVRSVAGYLLPPDGRRLTFALIFNGVSPSSSSVQEAEDAVLSEILKNP